MSAVRLNSESQLLYVQSFILMPVQNVSDLAKDCDREVKYFMLRMMTTWKGDVEQLPLWGSPCKYS